jgi:mRNA interferase RelE/StbE
LNIEYRKTFLKELAKIPARTRVHIENFVFLELPALESIFESGKIEKMKGYEFCYKVRFGEYRVGLKMERNKIILERVLHRKEIYRFFP